VGRTEGDKAAEVALSLTHQVLSALPIAVLVADRNGRTRSNALCGTGSEQQAVTGARDRPDSGELHVAVGADTGRFDDAVDRTVRPISCRVSVASRAARDRSA
jgi:hypothetical protein